LLPPLLPLDFFFPISGMCCDEVTRFYLRLTFELPDEAPCCASGSTCPALLLGGLPTLYPPYLLLLPAFF